MKTIKAIILLSFLILFSKCASSEYTVQNKGDMSEIELISSLNPNFSESKIEIELAIITDTSVIGVKYREAVQQWTQIGEVIEIGFENISKIEIMGYSNDGWILPVILFQVVPAIILTGTAMSVDTDNATIILPLLIPAALTSLFFATSDEETPTVLGRNLYNEKEYLKRFAKYPNGLSSENFAKFLSGHNQTETKRLSL